MRGKPTLLPAPSREFPSSFCLTRPPPFASSAVSSPSQNICRVSRLLIIRRSSLSGYLTFAHRLRCFFCFFCFSPGRCEKQRGRKAHRSVCVCRENVCCMPAEKEEQRGVFLFAKLLALLAADSVRVEQVGRPTIRQHTCAQSFLHTHTHMHMHTHAAKGNEYSVPPCGSQPALFFFLDGMQTCISHI